MEERGRQYHPHVRYTAHCYYCWGHVPDKKDRTKDHVIPRSKLRREHTHEELHQLRNHLVMACKTCNYAKADKSFEAFCKSTWLAARRQWVWAHPYEKCEEHEWVIFAGNETCIKCPVRKKWLTNGLIPARTAFAVSLAEAQEAYLSSGADARV